MGRPEEVLNIRHIAVALCEISSQATHGIFRIENLDCARKRLGISVMLFKWPLHTVRHYTDDGEDYASFVKKILLVRGRDMVS